VSANGKNGCEPFVELLSAALDQELAPEQARALEAHLAKCPLCRARRVDLEGAVALLRKTSLATPSESFLERLDVRLDQEVAFDLARARRWRRSTIFALAAAASILAVGLAGAFARREKELEQVANVETFVPSGEPSRPSVAQAPEPPASAREEEPAPPPPAPEAPVVAPTEREEKPAPPPDEKPAPEKPAPPEEKPAPEPAGPPPPATRQKDTREKPRRSRDRAALARLIREIEDRDTPADRRASQVRDLAEFDLAEATDYLGKVLDGALDRLTGAKDARLAAYEALGKVGDARAAALLVQRRRDASEDGALLGALSSLEDAKAVTVVASAVTRSSDEELRLLAIRSLERSGLAVAVDPLARYLDDGRAWDVARREAALALGAIGDPRAKKPLVLALRKPRPSPKAAALVREGAALALGQLCPDDDSTSKELAEQAHDPFVALREAVATALGRTGGESAIRPLVERTDPRGEPSRRVRIAAEASLSALSGVVQTGDDLARALAWRRWAASRRVPLPAARAAVTLDWRDRIVAGSGVVFLVDDSGSMAEANKRRKARDLVADGLSRIQPVPGLPPSVELDLVFFKDAPQPLWSSLVPATPGNVAQAIGALERPRPPLAGTDLLRGLRSALAIPGVDAVVLITDGIPTLGVKATDEIVAETAKANRAVRARISAVLLTTAPGAPAEKPTQPEAGETEEQRLLRRLALDNGGVFVKN
jgi:HEAT repeat protein